ncbi:hypothetical protein J3E72DRAFT_379981 [Bipolaris maydis]|nr:hypothetical protein J3E74DRAFT_295597 [Bipolaris maydis]KAJ6192191.1 hypothetical protein J3E72DRAFT_379981 [Bipolaris maydis]KAJ6267312.1 hypothetical protein PSV08DRAFT_186382 [Bipolaris maydis]KAJ6267729.1 hypothetical protein PSV08DRAFT_373792 [Bipolaris maydis]
MSESEPPISVKTEAEVFISDGSKFAGIDWERSLRGRLEEVVHYGLTILPYEEIFCLATKEASSKPWPAPELQRYLIGQLRHHVDSGCAGRILQRRRDLHFGYAEAFLTQFCLALENCCTNIRQQSQRDEDDKREEILWVYAPRQTEQPCITRRLPSSITDPINTILKTLLKLDTFGEDTLQIRGGEANAGQTLNLDALTEAWRREGYHEHLLRRYACYRMIKQAPSRQREVNLFVSQLFDKPWEKRSWDRVANRIDEPDLRIHYLR